MNASAHTSTNEPAGGARVAPAAVGAIGAATGDADVVGYRRVSSDEQAGEWKRSLDQQTERLHALARRLARVLAGERIYEDRFSGEAVRGRTGFQALLAYCQDHPRPSDRPGYALFYNDSRFGRFADPDEAAALRFRLKQFGWVVRFAELDDTDDPAARHMLRAIGGAGASTHLATIRANAVNGVRGAAAQGLWQSRAPLGYRRAVQPARGAAPDATAVLLDAHQRKPMLSVVRLALGPEAEVAAVRWMFEAYASGEYSLDMLAREMDARCPGRRWSRSTVRGKLLNPAYQGDVVWCRRPSSRPGSDAERHALPGGRRPKDRWVTARDAHPPIVSRALFRAAADRLAGFQAVRARTTLPGARGRGGYPLTGLLECAHCGRRYVGGGTGGGGTGRPDRDRERYRRYMDSGGRPGVVGEPAACPGRLGVLWAYRVEAAVVDAVAAVVEDPHMLAAVAAELRRALDADHAGAAAERRRLAARVAQLEREQENLVRGLREGVLADDVLRPEAARVAAALRGARDDAAAFERVRSGAARAEAEREIARGVALAADFRARAAALSGPALRELLARFVERGVVDKDARTVTLTIRTLAAPAAGVAAPSPAPTATQVVDLRPVRRPARRSRSDGPFNRPSAGGAPPASGRTPAAGDHAPERP